jgi:hypothetical protein
MCVVGPCAAACTGSGSSPRPTPIPSGSVPTAKQLIGAYASTLAHERLRFDSKIGDAEYIGTLDLAHDGLDLTRPGTGQMELRFLGSREWVRNAVATPDSELESLLNVPSPSSSALPSPAAAASNADESSQDSRSWLIDPSSHGRIESQIALQVPSAAVLTGLDRNGTSPVQKLGAADVNGTSTVGYQWSVTLPAAVDKVAKNAPGSGVRIQMRLDSHGRVAQLRLVPVPAAPSSAIAPAGSATPPPTFFSLDITLTLYDFETTPPITSPPNPITLDQLNAQQ